jgi:hypothetical protein
MRNYRDPVPLAEQSAKETCILFNLQELFKTQTRVGKSLCLYCDFEEDLLKMA